MLPEKRYFPAGIDHHRWLRSSPVEVGGAEIGRINARQAEDGRIEFAFTPTDGERIAPQARYFPADARSNRWLRSTEIAIGPPEDEAHGYTTVIAGTFHTCAIRTSGELECWGGYEHYGQTDTPNGRFTAVSANSDLSCAIRDTGEIECWGLSRDGRIPPPPGSFTAVSANDHACAIRESDSAIECWGHNGWKLPNNPTNAPDGRFRAVSVGGSTGSGGFYTCAIHETGTIECWGANYIDGGQHGYVNRAPEGSFTAVSTGYTHACGLRTTGEIECWGHNSVGQTDTPAGSFTALSGSSSHTCAIRASDSAIVCWGHNSAGQTDAPGGRFIAVSANGSHTCGLRENGEIACWGWNEYGQTDVPAD